MSEPKPGDVFAALIHDQLGTVGPNGPGVDAEPARRAPAPNPAQGAGGSPIPDPNASAQLLMDRVTDHISRSRSGRNPGGWRDIDTQP